MCLAHTYWGYVCRVTRLHRGLSIAISTSFEGFAPNPTPDRRGPANAAGQKRGLGFVNVALSLSWRVSWRKGRLLPRVAATDFCFVPSPFHITLACCWPTRSQNKYGQVLPLFAEGVATSGYARRGVATTTPTPWCFQWRMLGV